MHTAIRQLIATLVITVMVMSPLAVAGTSMNALAHDAPMAGMAMHQHDTAAVSDSCCDHGGACQGEHCDLAGCSHCGGCSMAAATPQPLRPQHLASNILFLESRQPLSDLHDPLFRPPRA